MSDLKHLGQRSNEPIDELDRIEWTGEPIVIQLDCSEFTSLCPVTGQPDFGELLIEYVPDKSLVETKSLKLYLWRYRDQAGFNEALVDMIATDIARQLEPLWLRVTGTFNPRGGIGVTATAERGDRERRPT